MNDRQRLAKLEHDSARNGRILLRLVDAVKDLGGKAAGELGMSSDVEELRRDVGEGKC